MSWLTAAPRSTLACLTLAALAAACSDAPTANSRSTPAAPAASRAAPSAPAAAGSSSLLVAPGALDFGRVVLNTRSDLQMVTVTNAGTGPRTVGNVNATGDYLLAQNFCPRSPATLAPGASCTIWVAFWPSRVGPQPGTLTIRSDAPDSAYYVALNGTGYIPSPDASVSPPNLGWGSVPLGTATSGRAVRLTSTGDAPLSVSAVDVGGANPLDFTITDECSGRTLSPGAWCTVWVSFEPTRAGARTATLTIAHNGSHGPSVVGLSGTGVKRPGPIP